MTSKSPRTFNPPGNHDMYCGGCAVLQDDSAAWASGELLLPAPTRTGSSSGWIRGTTIMGLAGLPTHLPPRQPEWVQDKVKNGERAEDGVSVAPPAFFESGVVRGGGWDERARRTRLCLRMSSLSLGRWRLWLWGHQHQFVAYADPRVKGTLHGAWGAILWGLARSGKPGTAIPLDPAIAAQQSGQCVYGQWLHADCELDGPTATGHLLCGG